MAMLPFNLEGGGGECSYLVYQGEIETSLDFDGKNVLKYGVIQKDGLNFVRLYLLNYTWYVNDLHNI
jgi:hypothetical protein